ncbi:MAG: PQQ-binding-like beta-propeller repeat protein, partial [Planctomycetota bacterium]
MTTHDLTKSLLLALFLVVCAAAGCNDSSSGDTQEAPAADSSEPEANNTSAPTTSGGSRVEADALPTPETQDLPASVVWRVPGPQSPMILPPIVHDGTLYFGIDQTIRAVDPATGQPKWVFRTVSQIEPDRQPLLAHGVLLVRCRGPRGQGSVLLAINADTGRLEWELQSFNSIREPVLFDDELYVPYDTRVEIPGGHKAGPEQILVIDPTTGEEKRRLDARSPIAVREDVLLGVRPDASDDDPFGEMLVALDPDTGELHWDQSLPSRGVRALMLDDSGAYYSLRQELMKIDPATGETIWRYKTRDRWQPNHVLRDQDTLFFITSSGGNYVHAVDRQSGRSRWVASLELENWDILDQVVRQDGTIRVVATSPERGEDPQPVTRLLMLNSDS